MADAPTTTPRPPDRPLAERARLETAAANTIRGLAIDAIEAAESGHPGLPMGMADAAVVLWTRFLKHDPADPAWPDRDRFVLSAGHGSMLLYCLLHLAGYDLSLDDLSTSASWQPDRRATPSAASHRGRRDHDRPLGQGIATAVGMALAERTSRHASTRGGTSRRPPHLRASPATAT